jgi:hypothetical protein
MPSSYSVNSDGWVAQLYQANLYKANLYQAELYRGEVYKGDPSKPMGTLTFEGGGGAEASAAYYNNLNLLNIPDEDPSKAQRGALGEQYYINVAGWMTGSLGESYYYAPTEDTLWLRDQSGHYTYVGGKTGTSASTSATPKPRAPMPVYRARRVAWSM